MIAYYKLFALLESKGMKKTDLLEIISSNTLAKLSKAEYVGGEIIDRLCIYLDCQPNDIMEVFEIYERKQKDGTIKKKKRKTRDHAREDILDLLNYHTENEIDLYEKIKNEIENNEQF